MIVYLVVNATKESSWAVASQAGDILASSGAQVVLDDTCTQLLAGASWPAAVMPQEEAYQTCDAVVCIGGDGTMLHVARHTIRYNKPLLGVNVGRLGFLTTVENNELDKLRRIPAGEYILDERSVLQADMGSPAQEDCLALNDVVLFKEQPEKTISLDIYCDDILVSRFRGDGIIFATPTGSTAYSMSAGGPVLDARLDGIVVTQICAHIVHTPPLVFAADRKITAVPTGPQGERVRIICDGRYSQTIDMGQQVLIGRSKWKVPMIQFNDAAQLESIDKKLKGR